MKIVNTSNYSNIDKTFLNIPDVCENSAIRIASVLNEEFNQPDGIYKHPEQNDSHYWTVVPNDYVLKVS